MYGMPDLKKNAKRRWGGFSVTIAKGGEREGIFWGGRGASVCDWGGTRGTSLGVSERRSAAGVKRGN